MSKPSARTLRFVMNVWPPFLFAGIRVMELSPDFRRARVRLSRSRLTTNYVGTQFGGSLFAMTDPFWMLLVMHNLGDDYIVWDSAAEIDFIAPARTAVTCAVVLEQSVVDELRHAAADGQKVLRWFDCDVTDADGRVVARVRKQVYVRLKRDRVRRPATDAANGRPRQDADAGGQDARRESERLESGDAS